MGGNINESNVWPATDTYPRINTQLDEKLHSFSEYLISTKLVSLNSIKNKIKKPRFIYLVLTTMNIITSSTAAGLALWLMLKCWESKDLWQIALLYYHRDKLK